MPGKKQNEVSADLLNALELFEVSQKLKRQDRRDKMFLLAVKRMLEEVGAFEPHAGELIKILGGQRGDATPGSLGLFLLTLLRDYPKHLKSSKRGLMLLLTKLIKFGTGKQYNFPYLNPFRTTAEGFLFAVDVIPFFL